MYTSTLESMVFAIEDYFECAGFANVYDQVIAFMSQEEIAMVYADITKEPELEDEWCYE